MAQGPNVYLSTLSIGAVIRISVSLSGCEPIHRGGYSS
jgi:hypothetical protein